MYRRSVRLLPLTIPFYFKSQLLMRGTVAFLFLMYRWSVRLLPLTIPFYFMSQLLGEQ